MSTSIAIVQPLTPNQGTGHKTRSLELQPAQGYVPPYLIISVGSLSNLEVCVQLSSEKLGAEIKFCRPQPSIQISELRRSAVLL